MKQLLYIFTLLLFLFLQNNQIQGQIQDIKKKSKENKENRKPKPKPSKNTKPVKKPCPKPSQKEEPVTINYESSSLWEPISNEQPIGSSSESHDFDGCFYALGALNPLPLFKRNKVGTSDSVSWVDIDPTFVSWTIRAHFDLGYHYSSNWRYTYVDFLPGVRLSLGFIMFDYRHNILTEYTDGDPDSFKSWELLALFNLLPKRNIKLFIGTGIHREQFSQLSFGEHYLGTKIGVLNNKNYFDADIRCSVDYKTWAFPFFETGIRYNKRLLNIDDMFGYITLGAVYQNYYQSHDIWSLRGGIVLNIY